jgi:hypothetical protein
MRFIKPLRFAVANAVLGAVLAGQALAANSVQGKVLEVKNTETYTYLLLKVGTQDTWAAVGLSNVKVGATVTLENTMEMKNFESKALKKTFPSIFFGNLQGDEGAVAKPSSPVKDTVAIADVKVSKATGPDAQTVGDVVNKAAALNNKTVAIHAKVVKVNSGIMGKNWLHLRDGSGKADDGSNDLLVTTKADATVGSTVTASGIVRTNKDFGSGYSYKVMLEDASIKP